MMPDLASLLNQHDQQHQHQVDAEHVSVATAAAASTKWRGQEGLIIAVGSYNQVYKCLCYHTGLTPPRLELCDCDDPGSWNNPLAKEIIFPDGLFY